MKSNNRCKKVMFGWMLVFSLIFGTTCISTFAETKEYTDEQGVKYSYDTSTHTASVVEQDNSLSGDITIPSTIKDDGITYSVTSIEDRAFNDCSELTSIMIPSSVTSLGEMVFMGCRILEEIKVDSENSVYSAKDGVLYNKDKTELIFYPEGKPDESFVVPESVTSIGSYVFMGCIALKSLSVGSSTKNISLGVCHMCTSLTTVTIPSSVRSIGDYAFSYCSSLESVTIESGVKEIGDYSFIYGKLSSVTLPESVVSLGEYAFAKEGGLPNIYVPSEQMLTESHKEYISDIWCYEVKEGQSTTPEGKTLVSITSHPKGDSDFIMCNGMGDTYEIEEIQVNGVKLKHGNLQKSDTVYPTCTESGHVPGYICEECGKRFVDEDGAIEIYEEDWELPALGHDYGAVIYTWSEDNSTCTATVTCANDETHVETEEVNTTIGARSEAGCEEEGFINYIAIFTNPAFLAQTKLVKIPAIDHAWREPTYTWSNDKSLCIAMRVCENDESHVEIEVGNITTEVTTPATYTEPGAGICTATFENPNFSQQTISIEIPATALLGDVTGDGSVNIKDYVKLYRYVQGLTTLTEEEKARADVNKDGSINIKDYVRLYRYVQGLIETL